MFKCFYHSGISEVAEKISDQVDVLSVGLGLGPGTSVLDFQFEPLRWCEPILCRADCVVGFCVAAVLISPSCRRILVFLLQGALAVLRAAPHDFT